MGLELPKVGVPLGKLVGRQCAVNGCDAADNPDENVAVVAEQQLCERHWEQWTNEVESYQRLKARMLRWLERMNSPKPLQSVKP